MREPSGEQPSQDQGDRSARIEEVRAKFVRERGFFAPPFEAIVQADPEFLDDYVELSSGPWRRGTLPAKVKEMVYVAVDASVTHQHAEGTAAHLRSALRLGATRAELVSVLELTSLLGLQSLELGVPLLVEACAPEAEPVPWLEALSSFDPDGAAAVRGWAAGVRERSPLDPAVIELVLLAANAATTHLHAAATRRHITAALAAGAPPAHVVEVLELVSVLGIHSATMAMPMLAEELDRSRLSPP
ncbi:carboxymuconolactone decarboxylase family protein [Nocardioides mangrovi]|uniref:Carboxymuconolactone decarboxylase family protein n=1 Tax=Nocardioides mangrovi TaxID=2874580 RepID=A0ABS7UFX3_9ACTN|nr:carboxymuconolactone decarboxylase family protein [Nocardioides mangrovi]MBZ5739543.1 carboxymuconolactone decarboxylase family protein [Nocardioides mangrovi]